MDVFSDKISIKTVIKEDGRIPTQTIAFSIAIIAAAQLCIGTCMGKYIGVTLLSPVFWLIAENILKSVPSGASIREGANKFLI